MKKPRLVGKVEKQEGVTLASVRRWVGVLEVGRHRLNQLLGFFGMLVLF